MTDGGCGGSPSHRCGGGLSLKMRKTAGRREGKRTAERERERERETERERKRERERETERERERGEKEKQNTQICKKTLRKRMSE